MKRTTYILLGLIVVTLILIVGIEVAISLTGKKIEYTSETEYLASDSEEQLTQIKSADICIDSAYQMPEITIIANAAKINANFDIDTIDNFTSNAIVIRSDSLIHVIVKQ